MKKISILQIFFLIVLNSSYSQNENGSIALGFKQGMIFSKPFETKNIKINELNQNSSSYNFSIFYLSVNDKNSKLHSGQIGLFNRALQLKEDTLNIFTKESIIDAKFSLGKRINTSNPSINFDYFVVLTFKTLFDKKYYTDKSFNFDKYPRPSNSMMFNIGVGPEVNLNFRVNRKTEFFFNQGFQMDMIRFGKAYKAVSSLFFDYYVNFGVWVNVE